MDDVDSTNFIEKKTNRYTQEETNTLLKTPPPLGALRVTRGPKAQGGAVLATQRKDTEWKKF